LPSTYDALIIGTGHDGLICAFYLAQAGLKVGPGPCSTAGSTATRSRPRSALHGRNHHLPHCGLHGGPHAHRGNMALAAWAGRPASQHTQREGASK